MSAVKIHFRSDDYHIAQCRFKGTKWEELLFHISKEEYDSTPLLVPGDIWRIHWFGESRALAGYAICCPLCGDVHHWTSATNCTFNLIPHTYKDDKGQDRSYNVCGHSGTGSCWDWVGSAEDGTLSASPSLLCHTCGYHGWLRSGELTSC